MNLGYLFLLLSSLSPFSYAAAKCGHWTRRTGRVSAFGQSILTEMPTNKNGSVDYCLDCLGKMAIQCAWCNGPIFVGDPVTLYTPRDNFQVPRHAVIYSKDSLQLVGCLGWNCAETGADRAGFWLPGENGKGLVERVQTAYEAILGAEVPSMMIVGDTHNIAEAMNPTLVPPER